MTSKLDRSEISIAPPSARGARGWLVVKIVLLGASWLLLARALSQSDWRAAGARIEQGGLALGLAFFIFPLGLALDAAAWRSLLARLGQTVSVGRLLRVRLATEAVSMALPAGGLVGEALGPALLAPEPGVAQVFASTTAKRWLIVRSHGIYVALAALVGWAVLSRGPASRASVPFIALGAGVALALGSFAIEHATSKWALADRLRSAAARLAGSRFRSFGTVLDAHETRAATRTFDDDLRSLGGRGHLVATALLFGQWMLEAVETFAFVRLLGADLAFHEVLAIDAALSVLRTVAVFAPAGVGVQDLGYLALFESAGVAPGVSAAFLVLKRTKELAWIGVGFGSLALTRARIARVSRQAA